MISHLRGKVTEICPTYVVVECTGVGYLAHISLNTFSQIKDKKEEIFIYTHFVVREDAQVLYGFSENSEREIFRHLISVSGIGANTARMMLSALSPIDLQEAIIKGDINSLKRIKGIGAKSAERVIVDLKDKIGKADLRSSQGTLLSVTPANSIKYDALQALIALGFAKPTAEKALSQAVSASEESATVEILIKKALSYL
jgi:Holliday junction DNA helicase RuvA